MKKLVILVLGLVIASISCKSMSSANSSPSSVANGQAEAQSKPEEPNSKMPGSVGQAPGVYTEKAKERVVEGMHAREIAPDSVSSIVALELKLERLSHDLARNAKGSNPTMVVATFVDMDRLNRSGTFGRFVAENMMGRMAKLGFDVLEVRTAKRLMVQPNVGEHALTEEEDEMKNSYRADTVLLGTYKKTGDVVVVHARLVAHSTQKIISSAAMEMKVEKDDPFMQAMFDNAMDRVGDATGTYNGVR